MNTRTDWQRFLIIFLANAVLGLASALAAETEAPQGYYRSPTIYKDTIIFTAEGDLWRVGTEGGIAQRLTSHPGQEVHAAISPDGRTLAFTAQYEGPSEVFTMPLVGGLPKRWTFEGDEAEVAGWTPDGKVLYSTESLSTLPDRQLATIDLTTGERAVLPLSQANQGVFDSSGTTLYFTRLPFQGSSTKRYQGGTIEHLWKYALGAPEAVPLTEDFAGTSKAPMFWEGRVYFVSDRDGTMNLWSMDEEGRGLRQLTTHKGWDVKSPALSEGRIVYQLGADLRLYRIADERDAVVPIRLASDFDHEREKWIKKPMDYLTQMHLSTNGDRVVWTARGQIFVAPVRQGRRVEVTHGAQVRYRQARFMPDNESILALSDESGELEFVRLPANGVGKPEPLTRDGKVFRLEGIPSPDGRWIAYSDKNQELWLFNRSSKRTSLVAVSNQEEFAHLVWSPDSQWLAFVQRADNTYAQIWLYQVAEDRLTALTSDRVNSFSPAWSPDGDWIYFLSDRNLNSTVKSPWGPRAPEPFFDKSIKLYLVSLHKDGRSPFEPEDELHRAEAEKKAKEPSASAESAKSEGTTKPTKDGGSKSSATGQPPAVTIDLAGLQQRLWTVPVPPGNYSDLSVNEQQVYWVAQDNASEAKQQLMTLAITNDEPKPKTLVEDVKRYELSLNGKKILIHKGDNFYVEDAGIAAPAKLEKSVDLKDWTFALNPRDEWRQMFVESWRLMRDFFYDPQMHGVDWPAILKKYKPLADRVTDRAELSDLISDMVGELSALHIFVVGGDFRAGPDQVSVAGLGARLVRDSDHGGYRIQHIYRADPDYPERLSPLAKPGLNIAEGDIIETINGAPTLSVPQPEALLRQQAGRQVLLRIRPRGGEAARDVIVTPLTSGREVGVQYDDWEYSRRLAVEEMGKGQIGYVHLRAMGANDIAAWARNFYPVFNRQGLIIDVRHNRGGNIDSWILEKLMRKTWFYWKGRVSEPTWNMQYAFRGHVVVLCNEYTASDGEAFTEGFRRLGLGKVIGTRTWGGEIWLSFDNWLVDNGIASAAEHGVYGPEGKWLIEGHGVDPDIVVDNLPHATFEGEDAQLKAAIKYLQEQIQQKPVPRPIPPPFPNKAPK
jgi:tricorn protease